MLLLSASEAAIAIGAKCSGSAPDQDDPALVFILRMLTPRVEAACDVISLTRGMSSDELRVPKAMTGAFDERLVFRLSNAFLFIDDDENPLVITDPDGETLDMTEDEDLDIKIDREKGLVSINKWIRGAYTIDYTSGFEAPDIPDTPPPGYDHEDSVLIGIPDWMKSIVIAYLTQWYRAVAVSPRGNKDISYSAVSEALNRAVHVAVHGKYQRLRANCIWADPL